MASTTKICLKCNTEKFLTSFKENRNVCTHCRSKKSVAKWVRNNRVRMTELIRNWRRANPDKVRTARYKRRSNDKNAEGSFTQEEWYKLCKDYNYSCAKCHGYKVLTPDHIKPLSKGGSNNIINIQPLCLSCNSSKGTKEIKYDRKVG